MSMDVRAECVKTATRVNAATWANAEVVTAEIRCFLTQI
jgi:hypothetical protein